MARSRLKKGDTVLVTAGKDRGKTGKVIKVLRNIDRVIVERINVVKRHQKGTSPQQPGGIVEKEASIHVSNAMPICPRTNKPTRVGSKRLEDGTRVRTSRRSGEVLSS
ncbi:MAG: 50S ribosomal protein L24 [Candidatus Binatia bacterium]